MMSEPKRTCIDHAPRQLSLLDFAEPCPEDPLMPEQDFIRTVQDLYPEDIQIALTWNRTSLISVKNGTGGKRIARVQHAFRAADMRTLKALARFLYRPDKRNRRIIDEFLREHSELVEQMGRAPARPRQARPKGEHRDLTRVLKKVMADYGIRLTGVSITWSANGNGGARRRRRRSIKFGSWCAETKTVRIHPDLDSPQVPDFFVEYIVYHELLHALFPPVPGETRRNVHNREFVRFEKKFENFDEAVRFEKLFVEKMLR